MDRKKGDAIHKSINNTTVTPQKNGWTDLFDAEVGVAGGDGLAVFVRERVEHRMVRMHRRQPVALELLADDVDEALHARLVVAPVAHDLQTVRQVAVRVRKVRLQLQGGAITLYGLRNISTVFVHRGQVGVGVRKGWVDLNSAGVALQGTLHVVHLL